MIIYPISLIALLLNPLQAPNTPAEIITRPKIVTGIIPTTNNLLWDCGSIFAGERFVHRRYPDNQIFLFDDNRENPDIPKITKTPNLPDQAPGGIVKFRHGAFWIVQKDTYLEWNSTLKDWITHPQPEFRYRGLEPLSNGKYLFLETVRTEQKQIIRDAVALYDPWKKSLTSIIPWPSNEYLPDNFKFVENSVFGYSTQSIGEFVVLYNQITGHCATYYSTDGTLKDVSVPWDVCKPDKLKELLKKDSVVRCFNDTPGQPDKESCYLIPPTPKMIQFVPMSSTKMAVIYLKTGIDRLPWEEKKEGEPSEEFIGFEYDLYLRERYPLTVPVGLKPPFWVDAKGSIVELKPLLGKASPESKSTVKKVEPPSTDSNKGKSTPILETENTKGLKVPMEQKVTSASQETVKKK